MRLHWTPSTRPGLLAVIGESLTPFPGHDLGDTTRRAPLTPLAEKCSGAGGGIRTFHSREIRSLLLPFAAPLLSHNHMAAG